MNYAKSIEIMHIRKFEPKYGKTSGWGSAEIVNANDDLTLLHTEMQNQLKFMIVSIVQDIKTCQQYYPHRQLGNYHICTQSPVENQQNSMVIKLIRII